MGKGQVMDGQGPNRTGRDWELDNYTFHCSCAGWVVTGGWGDDSVELNVDGNNGWTYGSPLSKPLAGTRTNRIPNYLHFIKPLSQTSQFI